MLEMMMTTVLFHVSVSPPSHGNSSQQSRPWNYNLNILTSIFIMDNCKPVLPPPLH